MKSTSPQRKSFQAMIQAHPGYKAEKELTSGLIRMAYIGDAIIRLWLRKRMSHDFGGKSGRAHEDILNSNEIMILFAQTMFPTYQGKRIADNFEAYIAWLDENNQNYNVVLETYYKAYMLTRPRRQKYWHDTEFKCPALRELRKANKV